jgi:hypothetical protein
VLESERRRVPPLDDDRRRRDLGEALHLEREGAVRQRCREVLQRLALDARDRVALSEHGVVACGERRPFGDHVVSREPVRVALARVDGDHEAVGDRSGLRDPRAGFAAWAALRVCQKIAGRPGVSVKTNCDRSRRGRSRTRSITAPRRRHESTGVCSTTSASAGQSSSNGWQ